MSTASARATPISRRITHIAAILLSLAACAPIEKQGERQAGCPVAPCPVCPQCPAPPRPVPTEARYDPVAFDALPGWPGASPSTALRAFAASCGRASLAAALQRSCEDARRVAPGDDAGARAFFERGFTPYAVISPEGEAEGLATGYYEPVLDGSRSPSAAYRFPIYGVPDDLLVIDLASQFPELRNLRLRGRVEGRRVVPYYSRGEIDARGTGLPATPIAWVADAIELFFLQIQGSGQIRLDSGERIRVGYAEQNGHPYRSLGRYLVDRGELKLEQASMQGIQAWAAANPAKLREALDANPSYVFFRELPAEGAALGALGVPLTAETSIAVDPRYLALGAPVYLATTQPLSSVPLEKLVVAQDTGGAIRGAVRVDFFWGSGPEAGALAGRMRQAARLWLLWPRGEPLPRP